MSATAQRTRPARAGWNPPWAAAEEFFRVYYTNLYNIGRDLVTGDAGRRLGDRAAGITEGSGDGTFIGGANDWVRFATRGVAGEMTDMNCLGEAGVGADMVTGGTLPADERARRGLVGMGSGAGFDSGGLGIADRAGLAPTFTRPSLVVQWSRGRQQELRQG